MMIKWIQGLVLLCASFLAQAQTDNPVPLSINGAQSRIYKTVGDTDLRLHIFPADNHAASVRHPAILFFFGGGWSSGTINQFVPHCRYFAERGMVAAVVDYRVKTRHGVTPFECVADARSALRWIREHATEYGIDPDRIVAAGGSAGGHLAACTAMLDKFADDVENRGISPVPNALVLFNPVVDMTAYFKDRVVSAWPGKPQTISPLHHMRKGIPPTLIFHGTADQTVPIAQVVRFCDEMKAHGNRCELITFEGREHGFFNVNKGDGADYRTTIEKTDAFLRALGYLDEAR